MKSFFSTSFPCWVFILFLTSFPLCGQHIMEQDFDGLDELEDFQGNPPELGQVEKINMDKVDGESIFSLRGSAGGDKFLHIHKRTDKRRHFDRLKGIDNLPFLKIIFRFSVEEIIEQEEETFRFAAFIVGGNLYNSSSIPIIEERWGQVGIHLNSNGSFFLANEERGNSIRDRTQNFTGERLITLVMNNSGGSLEYVGPGGEDAEINDQRVDIWVGEERLIENSEAFLGTNASANISALKFILWHNQQTARASLDDLIITAKQGFDPLPVEYVDFSAQRKEDDVSIEWQTSAEKSSSHFEVERSLDGKEFELIGVVEAAGDSKRLKYYTFLDPSAANRFSGILYYRLRQVDHDGAFQYSPIVSISLPEKPWPVRRIFPIPFKDQLAVSLLTDKKLSVNFLLLNMQGSILLEDYKLVSPAGEEQIFSLAGTESLAAGVYILEVRCAGSNRQYRLLKE